MKIIREKIDTVQRFKCTGCGSMLETEDSNELEIVDRNVYSYICPVCHLNCTINKAYVRNINVYEDNKES